MKKKYLLSMFLVPLLSFSQMRTTVANGNWSDPHTWDCSCIPGNNSLTTIDDSVTLDVSLSYVSGTIIINPGGKLIHDAGGNRNITFSGGSFVNSGLATFNNFSISGSNAALIQSGQMNVNNFTSLVYFSNDGIITMDSMYVDDYLSNGGDITGNVLISDSILSNYGTLHIARFINNQVFSNSGHYEGVDLNNLGVLDNTDTLLLSGNFWNAREFDNSQTNFSYTEVGGNFLSDNFGDSTLVSNSSTMVVLGDWFNSGQVVGSTDGHYIVHNHSENTGTMSGPFDFCDLTPPAVYPFIDVNSGTIYSGIFWCGSTSINEYEENSMSIFPNPTTDKFSIKAAETASFFIQDEVGRTVLTGELNSANNNSFSVEGLARGVYFIVAPSIGVWKKVIIQ